MAAYLKTDQAFFGVKKPRRAEIARELFSSFAPRNREEYEALVLALWAGPEREMQYLALDVAFRFKRFVIPESLPLFERLIREGQWWDLVDGVATNLVGRLHAEHRELMTPLLERWIQDEDLWIRRSAILSHNRHGAETDQQLLFDHCRRSLAEKDFFIRKAVGWALRSYSYAAPDAVQRFLVEHREEMSGLTFREGSKQLRRSGRLEG